MDCIQSPECLYLYILLGNDNDNIEGYITNETEKGKARVDRMTVCTWLELVVAVVSVDFCGFLVVFCGIQWLRWCGCSGCPTSHSRVRLVDALIVVVRRHGPTARHHHVVGIELWVEGIAAAPDDHIVRILLHFVVRRGLRRGRR